MRPASGGDFRQAVVHYQKCLETYPGNNYALFGLADCYKALNKYNQAIRFGKNIFSMTIQISPC